MVFGCCVLVDWIADAVSIKYCDSGSVFLSFLFSFGAVLCYPFHGPSGRVVFFVIVSKAARFSDAIYMTQKMCFIFFTTCIGNFPYSEKFCEILS
jgi:hypothetical protein